MPIIVACPGCLRRFRAADAAAGRQGTCPECRSSFTVPDAAEDLPSFAPIDSEEYAPIAPAEARHPPLQEPSRPPERPDPSPLRAWLSGFFNTAGGPSEAAPHVVVVDINLPFGSMVSLVFRWTMATLVVWSTIAAAIFLIGLVVTLLLTMIGMTVAGPSR